MSPILPTDQAPRRAALLWLVEASFMGRQPLFWLTGFCAVGFAFLLSQGLLLTGSDPVAQLSLLLQANHLLILPAVFASLTPLLLLRDDSHHTRPLIDCTALGVRDRWQLRMAGLFLASLGWLSIADLVSTFSFASSHDDKPALLAFAAGYLVQSLMINSLCWLAIATLLCAVWRSSMVVYVSLMCLMGGYLFLASMTGSPLLAGSSVSSEGLYQAMLALDPLNYTADSYEAALRAQQSASASEQISAALPDSLINRGAVLLLSLALLKLALRLFSQPARTNAHAQNPSDLPRELFRNSDQRLYTPALLPIPTQPSTWPHLTMLQGLIRGQLRLLLQSRLNHVLFILWSLFILNEVLSGLRYAEPLAQIVTPTMHDALNRVMYDMVPVVGSAFLALCCWQLVSAPQRAGFAELLASQPWPNGLLWLSQAIVSLGVAIALTLSALVACVLAFWLQPLTQDILSEPRLTRADGSALLTVLGVQSLAFMLWAWLLLAFGQWVRTPLHLACLFSLALVLKFTPLMAALGLAHPFWNLASLPVQPGDTVWQFRVSARMLSQYAQFWLVLAWLLTLVALAYSRRGSEYQPVPSVRLSTRRLWTGAGLIASVAWVGINHQALSTEKPLLNQQVAEHWRAKYEQQYGVYATQPSLSIRELDAHIDFYPNEQRAQLTLHYRLQNQTTQPITDILIGRYGNYAWPEIDIDATPLEMDRQLNQARYRWDAPVQPGEQRHFVARFSYQQPQWWPAAFPHLVTPEFSVLRSVPLIPVVGFQPSWRVRDAHTRQQLGLPALADMLTTNTPNAASQPQGAGTEQERYQWYPIHSTLSAPMGYQVLAPGLASDVWQQQGRQFQRFQSNRPMRDLAAWLCIQQPSVSVGHTQGTSTALQLFFTRGQDETTMSAQAQAVASIIKDAMHDTLSWFAEEVTPYPAEQLNAILVPALGLSGYALPQILLFDQRLMLNSAPEPSAKFDQRYRRAVHETAHQWFGHDLGNGSAEQSSFLIESLTKYVELVLIEQRYGKAGLQGLIDYERQRYEATEHHDISPNTALIYAEQQHEQYAAATLVFAILRERLGDERITQALRSLWQQHHYPQPPAQAMDFVQALNASLNEEQRRLVTLLLVTPGGLNHYLASSTTVEPASDK